MRSISHKSAQNAEESESFDASHWERAPISKIKAKTLALNGMRQKRKATPRCSIVKTCGPTSSGGFIFLPFGFCSRTIQYWINPAEIIPSIFSLNFSKNGLNSWNKRPKCVMPTVSFRHKTDDEPLRKFVSMSNRWVLQSVKVTALFAGSATRSNSSAKDSVHRLTCMLNEKKILLSDQEDKKDVEDLLRILYEIWHDVRKTLIGFCCSSFILCKCKLIEW